MNGIAKCSSDHANREQGPPAVAPVQIKRDFRRQIARPDDDVLRIGHVNPQNHERHEQVAEVMEGVFQLVEQAFPRQPYRDENGERERRQPLRRDNQQSKDGGKPAGLQRHQPVYRGKRHRDDVQYQAGAAPELEASGVVGGVTAP